MTARGRVACAALLSRPGVGSIPIWLATEHFHLPVRVRHYDRKGNYSGERVVSEIRISQD